LSVVYMVAEVTIALELSARFIEVQFYYSVQFLSLNR